MAAPHTLSSWQQGDDLPTETGVTLSPSPPGDSKERCLVDAVNRLWSYALREALTAHGLVGSVHHHLDPTMERPMLKNLRKSRQQFKVFYKDLSFNSTQILLLKKLKDERLENLKLNNQFPLRIEVQVSPRMRPDY